MEGKQVDVEPRLICPLEKMGRLIYDKTIILKESFLTDVLMAASLQVGKATNVVCPFCQKGFLKLNQMEPIYSGGVHPRPAIKEHTGDTYEFICTGEDCKGKFEGTYIFKNID